MHCQNITKALASINKLDEFSYQNFRIVTDLNVGGGTSKGKQGEFT